MAGEENDNGRVTIALLGQQLTYISTQVDKLGVQVQTALIGAEARDEKLTGLYVLLRDYKELEDHVSFMLPWVKGLKWFVILVGGFIIGGVSTGVLGS